MVRYGIRTYPAPTRSERVRWFHTTSEERDKLVMRFHEEVRQMILAVHNMLLAGFEAPVLETMHDKAELVKTDDFVENTRDYLVDNVANSSGVESHK